MLLLCRGMIMFKNGFACIRLEKRLFCDGPSVTWRVLLMVGLKMFVPSNDLEG